MKKVIVIIPICITTVLVVIGVIFLFNKKEAEKEREEQKELLIKYFSYIEDKNYEAMYKMVILPEDISKEDFLTRNENIYEGIEASNIEIKIISIEEGRVTYNTKMKIRTGNIEFVNNAELSKNENKEYKIKWSSNLIFPELNNDYKVRVSTIKPKRGSLLDRNNNLLATQEGETRVYPYKEATSHITGYVQSITAEELVRLQDKGYRSSSIIGKTGLEKAYEERLKGTNGVEIYIENSQGERIKTISKIDKQDGENIKLTIDINLQLKLYQAIQNDRGIFVVMNPRTGEILALVSTPSYDANKFITGMSNEEWSNIVNNEAKPLYTKFLGSWCPGSTFKPVTGAVGLTSGKLLETDEFSYTGLAWQKDSSWKEHKVTTLTPYSGSKNLKNAIIYSDNIYFAQAALKIGEQAFTQGLDKIKFNENINFDLPTSKSQYSNSEGISSESILADSGYGQGQVLVNPIHMASIYSAFVNDGNMVKPYLEYKENKSAQYLVENAFTKEAADVIKEAMIQVVENPRGTGHDVKVEGITIAGKTGTAELKTSKEAEGDTLGWFNCFTTDENIENPLLIVSMVENESSRYLKKIIRSLF